MKNPRYTHDMMHCQQEQCPNKAKCYRYWLGQNAIANGFTTFSVYYPNKKTTILANCKYYLNIKDY